jgi:GT2 family glycosyltransferase
MNLSIVVTTYDRQDDLIECIQSIDRQFEPPEEIIVVADGDISTTRNRLEAAGFESVDCIAGKNEGLPAARNAGAAAATGDVIAFVDDDVVLPPNWSRELRWTYEQFPEAVGVGGYVLNYNPSGINKANVDSFGYRLLQGLRKTFLHRKVGHVSPIGILWAPHVFMTSDLRRVDSLQGCNMSFKSDVFDSYYFDEWYGTSGSAACEELDFCVRLSRNGNSLIYNPRMVTLHKRSLSGDTDTRAVEPNYGNMTNLTYFILNNTKMGLSNIVLFTAVMLLYAIIKRELGYLTAIQNGILAYRSAERRTPDRATGSDADGP